MTAHENYSNQNLLSANKMEYVSFNTTLPIDPNRLLLNSNKSDPSKTFACNVCGRTYRNIGSLRRHVSCECGKMPSIFCTQCKYKAFYKFDMDKHFRKKHLKTSQPASSGSNQ